ncbi:hypothetical protein [Bacteroides sp. UBA939]|uniref:hypothetical protein n=1 Tax=Bacteroides sp. UBA939 TaxID=1946092 RepID=UPI0025BE2448|nr:hypothetical protein [Bacteroides sp. UBA939]
MIYTITTSVSCFLEKPNHEEIRKIEYIRKNLSLDEIANFIKSGYVLSANFTNEYDLTIKQHQRTCNNFTGTHFIMIDLDNDVKCDLGELVDMLQLKPTIAYTTYSHQQEGKGNRYRLLFFFKEELVNIDVFRELYDKIVDINKLSISDNCGRNAVQAVFGSYHECELINTCNLYSINQFQLNNKNQNGHSNPIRKEEKNNIEIESLIQDKEYINDYWNMSYTDLIAKYNDKYYFFQHTPLEPVDDDTPYIILPPNYIEIIRYWIYHTNYKEDGDVRNITTKVKPIRDGEGRRRKLYLNGILRRMMIDKLSFEHLLHCLVNELYYYIDNSKDKIDKKQLIDIAFRSYKADLQRYKEINIRKDKRKYIVNDGYCVKHSLNKRQVSNLSKKLITYSQIGELYDVSLTDKANVEVFKEYGLNISTKTLQRFRQEMGITKYQKGNGHSDSIRKEEENNIEIECPIQSDMDKPYYDYQSELILQEMDSDVHGGYYDINDRDDVRAMVKTFIRRAKTVNPNYDNGELIKMFKMHYELAC